MLGCTSCDTKISPWLGLGVNLMPGCNKCNTTQCDPWFRIGPVYGQIKVRVAHPLHVVHTLQTLICADYVRLKLIRTWRHAVRPPITQQHVVKFTKKAQKVRRSLVIHNGMNKYAKIPATCITKIQVHMGFVLEFPCIVSATCFMHCHARYPYATPGLCS